MAVFTPINWPSKFNRGPPLLPLLSAASVWIKSTYVPNPSTYLPLALIIPVVTVVPKPKGLPIATTHWPILIFLDFPKVISVNILSALILSRAKSVLLSNPTISALYLLSSINTTSISFARSITW